ncbi:MAG TPA: polymer-forming cytoskeletal protein [Noviherbaspirillum sp.]|uniref:bactofilin family protein n=1 Tax=Noviherbaspirillum sp. TaxID=1926288 RepID=UPI002B4694DA|nr:polymer-forming cytoskeletal protein [Noviherbaspirillum sp.]HJV88433.1 polymer-forming cytoskeletal protein [Noviherbaspirillum sp.]
MTLLVFFAFAILAVALLLLPFVPAWQEWQYPTDCAPLPIPHDPTSDILYLRDRFLQRALSAPGKEEHQEQSLLRATPDCSNVPWSTLTRPILLSAGTRIAQPVHCMQPVLAEGDLSLPAGSCFNALMCEGALELGNESEIVAWAHARGAVRLGPASIALDRLSSDTSVEFGPGSGFSRVSAPAIRFGPPMPGAMKDAMMGRLSADDFVVARFPGAIRRAADTWLVSGDCVLPAGRFFKGALIVSGLLRIGDRAAVVGNLKARRGIIAGRGAFVDGALVSEQDIDIQAGAHVEGPVVSEARVHLGAGARIGSPDALTTITAPVILARIGAVVHGTLWARRAGLVEA